MSPTTTRSTRTRRTKRLGWVALGASVMTLAACRPAPQHLVLNEEGGGHTTTTVAVASAGSLEITVLQDGDPVAGVDGWAFPTDVDPQTSLSLSRTFTTDGSGHATIDAVDGTWGVQATGEYVPSQDDPLCGRGYEDDAIVQVATNGPTAVTLDLVLGPLGCQ